MDKQHKKAPKIERVHWCTACGGTGADYVDDVRCVICETCGSNGFATDAPFLGSAAGTEDSA